MKKLGFGLLRLPLLDANDPASIDIEAMKELVDTFLEEGFTYFDTAYLYSNYASEQAVKTVLTDRYPRDRFQLATKLPNPWNWKTTQEREQIFQKELERTGLTYFDYYLLHNVNCQIYDALEQTQSFQWILEKKHQGLAKQVGFSYHDGPELLDRILTLHPEMDFVQLQINYLDWESTGVQSRKCYEVAVKHNKPVIVMEPVKGGTLANVPSAVEQRFKEHRPEMSVSSWAVRFAAGLDNVMMVLSGMSNLKQVLDNTSYMKDFQPLNQQEQAIVREAADIINASVAVPCTGCGYCVKGCSMNIPIPRYFSLYNADMQVFDKTMWSPHGELYRNLVRTHGKASDCIGCAQCESACPQHLPVIEYLKDVSRHFEPEHRKT